LWASKVLSAWKLREPRNANRDLPARQAGIGVPGKTEFVDRVGAGSEIAHLRIIRLKRRLRGHIRGLLGGLDLRISECAGLERGIREETGGGEEEVEGVEEGQKAAEYHLHFSQEVTSGKSEGFQGLAGLQAARAFAQLP
jgi:hypothetical protein